MVRGNNDTSQNQFMEVSGIDPAIVREEQQAVERANSASLATHGLNTIQPNSVSVRAQQQAQAQQQQFSQPESQTLFTGENSSAADEARFHSQQLHGLPPNHQPQYAPVSQQSPYIQHPDSQLSANHQPMKLESNVNMPTPGSEQQQGHSQSGVMGVLNDRLSSPPNVNGRLGKRRVRLGWTDEETRHLMEGCRRHGVGNWKRILTDPSFEFNCRTAVDLKDRFRTSFPDEYSRLYPNARTHKVKRAGTSAEIAPLVKINRKERRSFTPDEDERLLQGFLKHGPAWSKIQRDTALNLSSRRSTDLRDRFRNAFPERYTAAGYKGRTSAKSQSSMQSVVSDMPVNTGAMPPNMHVMGLDEEVSQYQHPGMLASRGYIPPGQLQHPLQMQNIYQTPTMYYNQMNQINAMSANFYRPPPHNSQNPQQS